MTKPPPTGTNGQHIVILPTMRKYLMSNSLDDHIVKWHCGSSTKVTWICFHQFARRVVNCGKLNPFMDCGYLPSSSNSTTIQRFSRIPPHMNDLDKDFHASSSIWHDLSKKKIKTEIFMPK